MYIAAESLSRLIGFDPQLLFDAGITAINVFILFFALSYLLFNPAQNLLKKRSEKIKTELENAKTKDEGKMVIGWKQIGDDMYFFQADGSRLENAVTPDGFIVGADGKRLPTI